MARRITQYGNPARPSYFFEDPDVVDDPILAVLLDYWRKQQKGRSVPLAADFAPKDIKKCLPWVIVVDAFPDYSDFRYRVIGSNVTEYFLADATGATVSEAYRALPPEIGDGVKYAYRRTCKIGRPTRATGPEEQLAGTFFPPFDCLMLPYATSGEHANRLVLGFTFRYDQVRAHRAFTLANVILANKSVPTPQAPRR